MSWISLTINHQPTTLKIVKGMEVVVLGAGVVGLSSALCVQKLLPHVKVTIIADKLDSETTSFGSGGIFVPSVPDTDQHNEHRYLYVLIVDLQCN